MEIERSFELHYTSRTRADAAFLRDCEGLGVEPSRRAAHLRARARWKECLTFPRSSPARRARLPFLRLRARADAGRVRAGRPSRFRPPARIWSVSRASRRPRALRAGSNVVVLARSGMALRVPPGKPILDVLLDEGVEAPRSPAWRGVCGSCRIKVLEGVPRPIATFVLSAEERAANTTPSWFAARAPRLSGSYWTL